MLFSKIKHFRGGQFCIDLFFSHQCVVIQGRLVLLQCPLWAETSGHTPNNDITAGAGAKHLLWHHWLGYNIINTGYTAAIFRPAADEYTVLHILHLRVRVRDTFHTCAREFKTSSTSTCIHFHLFPQFGRCPRAETNSEVFLLFQRL